MGHQPGDEQEPRGWYRGRTPDAGQFFQSPGPWSARELARVRVSLSGSAPTTQAGFSRRAIIPTRGGSSPSTSRAVDDSNTRGTVLYFKLVVITEGVFPFQTGRLNRWAPVPWPLRAEPTCSPLMLQRVRTPTFRRKRRSLRCSRASSSCKRLDGTVPLPPAQCLVKKRWDCLDFTDPENQVHGRETEIVPPAAPHLPAGAFFSRTPKCLERCLLGLVMFQLMQAFQPLAAAFRNYKEWLSLSCWWNLPSMGLLFPQ